MALAERHLRAKLGENIINHKTFVIAGDGCLMEGISQEAISIAGHHQLEKLIVLYDSNQISIDGPTDLAFSENIQKRFDACSWHVQSVDGHNPEDIHHALSRTDQDHRPHLIICNTTIGYGSPHKAGSHTSHGSPLGEQEITLTKKALGLENAPFAVDPKALEQWRNIGKQGSQKCLSWEKHIKSLPQEQQSLIHNTLRNTSSVPSTTSLNTLKKQFVENPKNIATRAASRLVLNHCFSSFPTLLGGSADLTESNQTRADNSETFSKQNPLGNYVHYGVREHAMVAAMSGMALHGGIIPYGGTFLSFSDYARPALRLAALMKLRVILVGTHDSIGLGEDGPTHQPVEHLAALRTIPNLLVFRPCDPIETAECWHIALSSEHAPSVIALSRQGTPTLRESYEEENLSASGAYLLKSVGSPSHKTISLIASGTEVALAISTAEMLTAHNVHSHIISVPCLDLFRQNAQKQILGNHPRFVIEAGTIQGWEGIISQKGLFFGLHDFGLSAPAKELYQHFKLTPEDISHDIIQYLSSA
jgi:transketolase